MGKQGGLPGDRKPGDGRCRRRQEGQEVRAARRPARRAWAASSGNRGAPRRQRGCPPWLRSPSAASPYQAGPRQGLPSHGGGVRREPGAAAPQRRQDGEDRSKVDDLRGTPMSVGSLEEIIDESHAIVSSSVGPEYYVSILLFVDKDQLEPGCSILMHNKVLSVVGILQDEVDPMVSVMKVEKAPLESYADIGGLDAQIQEIKEAVELPLTHPELYEDIGIRPPKGVILYGEPGNREDSTCKEQGFRGGGL
ncbi:26S protease regulatory subunit 4 [Hordeum vulgare]|nr:26S protease regulatory subunit 4 [Hordeum vulgare]